MTVITSTIIESGGISRLSHPSAPWAGFSPNTTHNRRVEDEEGFQTWRAGRDVRGRRFSWRDDDDDRAGRRVLPHGRERPHDGLRLQHHGAMSGRRLRYRRRLLPRSESAEQGKQRE